MILEEAQILSLYSCLRYHALEIGLSLFLISHLKDRNGETVSSRL